MTTQVATSHTVSHRPSAPLKVPRRPPRNDITQAIQKFLPYVFVFLLSLIVYSSFKSPKTVSYPPYSPPNTLPEDSTQTPPLDFANTLNQRTEKLAQLIRKAEQNAHVKPGYWATWRAQKAKELDAAKKAAEEQMPQGSINAIPAAIGEVFETVKSKSEEILDDTMDAAEWWKIYGEKIVEEAKDFGADKLSSTQDFAYDAMYSWKQKAGELKQSGAEKVESVVDVAKEKLDEVKESASEWVSAGLESLGEMRDKVSDRVEGLNTGISQAEYDMRHRGMAAELMRTQNLDRHMQNGSKMSFADRLSSLISGVKETLSLDEEARQMASWKEEWSKIDASKRADMIIQQLQGLGGEVVEEIFRKLGLERPHCQCLDSQAMCPK